MLGTLFVACSLSALAGIALSAIVFSGARNEDLVQMLKMRRDLHGNCKICKSYDVYNFLRGEGDCARCRFRPGSSGKVDNWRWRGE